MTKKNNSDIVDDQHQQLVKHIFNMNKLLKLASTFSGSYDLLKFVLNKYDLYQGKVSILAEVYNYTDKQRWGDYPKWWHYQGIPLRVWNLLHKDLTILSLSGRIDFDNLEKLKTEYESIGRTL